MVSELEKAAQLGYKVFFHELHFYKKTDYILKDFVQLLASEKLRYTNIFKNIDNDDIKDFFQCRLTAELNQTMNFPPSLEIYPHHVFPNEANKTLIKNCLNSFFGRFALHNNQKAHYYCKTREDYMAVMDKDQDIIDFFSFKDSLLEIETQCPTTKIRPSNKGCLYITSEINALARVFIYEKSEEVEKAGGIVLSLDTDSILFALPKNKQMPFEISDAFGHFKHVLGDNCEITDFYSLGPRNYSVVYKETWPDGRVETNHVVKVKGLSLVAQNCQKFLPGNTYSSMIDKYFEGEVKNVYIPQMRTQFSPSTKDSVEILTEFNFTNELHVKRFLNENFCAQNYKTYPYGFYCKKEHQMPQVKLQRKRKSQDPIVTVVKKSKF
jgi:hypothetical protein